MLTIAFGLLLCIPGGTGSTSKPERSAELLDNDPFRTIGPYCGVYAVYGCLRLFGKSTALEMLLEPRYVGSRAGSTLAELIRAVEDCGLRSRALRGLTAESLKAADAPIILHVKDRRRTHEYNHWLLYLGEQDGKARVLDPPGSVEVVPFAQILARWDGTGLVVSNRPIETSRYVKATWLGTLTTLCLPVAFTAFVLSLAKTRSKVVSAPKRFPTFRRIGRETIALVGCSLSLATAYHQFSSEGFYRNRAALASVQTRFYTENMPEYSVEEMTRVVQDPKTVVIDARLSTRASPGRDQRSGQFDDFLPNASARPSSQRPADRSLLPKRGMSVRRGTRRFSPFQRLYQSEAFYRRLSRLGRTREVEETLRGLNERSGFRGDEACSAHRKFGSWDLVGSWRSFSC